MLDDTVVLELRKPERPDPELVQVSESCDLSSERIRWPFACQARPGPAVSAGQPQEQGPVVQVCSGQDRQRQVPEPAGRRRGWNRRHIWNPVTICTVCRIWDPGGQCRAHWCSSPIDLNSTSADFISGHGNTFEFLIF